MGEDRRVQVGDQILGAWLGAPSMLEPAGEANPAINFNQELGQVDSWKAIDDLVAQLLGAFGRIFAADWRHGQIVADYVTLIVDHVTGQLVWAAEGRSKKVVERFFEQLGPQRCAQLTHVSSDGAEWILGPVEQHCPNATICLDPFHVVQWATNALDKVRRTIWNQTRRSGKKTEATELKGSRWLLLRNAQDLTANETAKLALVAKLNGPLYRAYLLKEQLRMIFHVGYDEAIGSLERWLQWARRCRIDAFVALARTITYYRPDIEATLLHGVNNGRVESLNTKIRLIARRAFGFRSAQALIALSELGGLCPPLPGRQPP